MYLMARMLCSGEPPLNVFLVMDMCTLDEQELEYDVMKMDTAFEAQQASQEDSHLMLTGCCAKVQDFISV